MNSPSPCRSFYFQNEVPPSFAHSETIYLGLIHQLNRYTKNELLKVAKVISKIAWKIIPMTLNEKSLEKFMKENTLSPKVVAEVMWHIFQTEKQKSCKDRIRFVFADSVKLKIKSFTSTELVALARSLDDVSSEFGESEHEIPLFNLLQWGIHRSKALSPRDIAMGLFAFRKRYPHNEFLKKMQNFAISNSNINFFEPFEISLMVKALTQTGYLDKYFYNQLSYRIEIKASEFDENDIVRTLWAYAYADWKNNSQSQVFEREFNLRVAKALINPLCQKISHLTPKQLIKAACSLQKLKVTETKVFAILAEPIIEASEQLNVDELVHITQALAQILELDSNLLDTLIEKTIPLIEMLTPELLIKLAASLSIPYCRSNKYEDAIGLCLNQLSQYLDFNFDEEMFSAFSTTYHLYLLKSLKNAFLPKEFFSFSLKKPESSPLENDIVHNLQEAYPGLEVVKKYCIGSFFADIVIIEKGVVIEVDTLNDFDENRNYFAKTVLKDTFFSMLGWKVIHIPYFEWQAFKNNSERHYVPPSLRNRQFTSEEKQNYLKEKIGKL